MKRIGYLYEKIQDTGNLFLALRKALRGKRDKQSVKLFLAECRKNMRAIQVSLTDCTWQPWPYNTFTIHEPKKRLISAASFSDRVVHHAIMNIIEPYMEKFSVFDSYACRQGKGLHAAVARAFRFQKQWPYFLKMDIRHYFESVDHDVLYRLLARQFKDKKLLKLFKKIIISSNGSSPGKGLPIGNLTSQHFANFYLGYLDHFIKDGLAINGYVRYMDDFCIWANSKLEIKKQREAIRNFLKEKLRLKLKEKAERLAPVRYGMPFLGFRIFPNHIRMKRETLVRFNTKIKRHNWQIMNGDTDINRTVSAVQSIYSFVNTATCGTFLKNHAVRLTV